MTFRHSYLLQSVDLEDEQYNVLEWWRSQPFSLPKMAAFAKTVLCAQASSAAVERLFSRSGMIVSKLS